MSGKVHIKAVIVGDGAVGKTCLLMTYVQDKFPSKYVPTVFDNQTVQRVIDGRLYELELWDTAGQEDYDRIRPLSYSFCNCMILCFSLVDRATFNNVRNKWYPEISHFCGDVSMVLVGTKLDMRADSTDYIKTEEAMSLKDEFKFSAYVESSAKTREGVADVFETSVRSIKNLSKPSKRKCNLL